MDDTDIETSSEDKLRRLREQVDEINRHGPAFSIHAIDQHSMVMNVWNEDPYTPSRQFRLEFPAFVSLAPMFQGRMKIGGSLHDLSVPEGLALDADDFVFDFVSVNPRFVTGSAPSVGWVIAANLSLVQWPW